MKNVNFNVCRGLAVSTLKSSETVTPRLLTAVVKAARAAKCKTLELQAGGLSISAHRLLAKMKFKVVSPLNILKHLWYLRYRRSV